MSSTVRMHVKRYSPKDGSPPHFQEYTVPYHPDMVVLDALNYVKDELDGSLTFRWSCRMGVCGSCGAIVNDRPVLTCAALLRDIQKRDIFVEPLHNFPIIKDLVVDIEDFMGKLEKVRPWVIEEKEKPLEEGEYLQTTNEMERYHHFSMCINCMLCYSACPVYGMDKEFIGPAAAALGLRYNLDTRDRGRKDRLEYLMGEGRIWDCTFVGECSAVCPKSVDPALALQRLKVESTLVTIKSLLMPRRK